MRTAFLVAVLSMVIAGCQKETPKLPQTHQQEATNTLLSEQLAELKQLNESQSVEIVHLGNKLVSAGSELVQLERDMAAKTVENAKLTTENLRLLSAYNALANDINNGKYNANRDREPPDQSELERQYKEAAIRFAQLGNIEKQMAIDAFQRLKKGDFDSVAKDERNLVEQVGTKEAVKLVEEWDLREARKFGFDPKTGVISQSPSDPLSDLNAAKLESRIAEIPKLIASKRKSMKDIQAKGSVLKKQRANMDGNETPAGLKKIADLEKQFADLKSDYDKLAGEVDALERESKGEKPNDGYGSSGYR